MATSETIYHFNLSDPNVQPTTIPSNVITALHMDKLFFITADKDGNLAVLHTKTGMKYADLNAEDVKASDSLQNRVNVVQLNEKDKTYVFTAHEANRVCVWDIEAKNQRLPVDKYIST